MGVLTVTGSYVRLMAGDNDENGRPKYRVHKITGVDHTREHGKYSIEYQGRQMSDSRALMCQYGKMVRLYRIADVSNGDIDEVSHGTIVAKSLRPFLQSEFNRFSLVNKTDNVRAPRRSELKRKHEEIVALRDRAMTEDEVNRQVESRKQTNPAQRQKAVLQITSLMSSKQLALRRNDHDAADSITQQIIDLGGDPNTGQLLSAPDSVTDYDARIQRINENNKRKTREAMAKAHEAALARKKTEEAIVKAKA